MTYTFFHKFPIMIKSWFAYLREKNNKTEIKVFLKKKKKAVKSH